MRSLSVWQVLVEGLVEACKEIEHVCLILDIEGASDNFLAASEVSVKLLHRQPTELLETDVCSLEHPLQPIKGIRACGPQIDSARLSLPSGAPDLMNCAQARPT